MERIYVGRLVRRRRANQPCLELDENLGIAGRGKMGNFHGKTRTFVTRSDVVPSPFPSRMEVSNQQGALSHAPLYQLQVSRGLQAFNRDAEAFH